MSSFADFLWNGSPPKNVTSTSTSIQGIPDWYQEYQKGILAKGNAIANNPYPLYPGPRVAPLTQQQQQAYQQVSANQGNWQPALSSAQQTTGALTQNYDPNQINQFMSPYVNGVVDRIAQLGQRNLSENLLPAVNDTFTGAGQFGSSRHADFTNRALRDVNESILGQQSTALQQAYDSANNNMNQFRTSQLNAANQLGTLGQMQQQLGTQDSAALEAAGQAQQQQTQKNYDTSYQDFMNQAQYPQQMTEWLNNMLKGQTVPTSTSTTTNAPLSGAGYSPSPLASLAGTYALFKGLKKGGRVTKNMGPLGRACYAA